jgi:hypothetical protein
MALGAAVVQQRFETPRELLGDRLREGSIYRLLADHGDRLFPDGYFADLYKESVRGRPTVPARVLATVMVLQAFEGLSDREATDRLEVDLRWQAAAGVDAGVEAFHATVLVGQRNRLRASSRPRRLFEDTKVVARQLGALRDRARVLDSTPLLDAVATEDTVTQLRAAIRKLLVVLDNVAPVLAGRVRAVLERDDDYATAGKPPCDWDDPAAREQLVDELVHDALAALAVLDGVMLSGAGRDAADLLAIVAGQDVEAGDDGVFRIVRGVARDRVISTVDPQARHGHKSLNRRFDGYKTHVSVDPDSELIDEATVTPANTPDRDVVDDLLAGHVDEEDKPEVVGDSAYADGETSFKPHCRTCPLRNRCTAARRGRSISIHRHEAVLQQARREQHTADWIQRYRADRPIVERKLAHFARRLWGGRHARCRGLARIATDVDTRAAALNLARLAVLGVSHDGTTWAASTS